MAENHNNYDALHFKDRTIKLIRIPVVALLNFQILISQLILK